jgi:rhamnosyl/mannosyltransferase
MRILHISKYYHPYVGGVENVCKYLADHSAGHEVAVVCFNEGRANSVDIVDGIKVYRVGVFFHIARQAVSWRYQTVLRHVIRDFCPDLIQFHWANPFPAAIMLPLIPKQTKLLIYWHMDILKQHRLYSLVRPIERRLLQRADMITVTSPQYKEYSVPLQPFSEKVRIVPNGIDDTKLVPPSQKELQSIRDMYDGKDIVLFVGRHILYKGLSYLIEAEKYVKSDCVFVIAGDGPLTQQLKNSCQSDRVFFVGKLSDEMLKRYLYASSVFAFPSITKNEAFGMALAEAMYCNTPAVTFTIPGSGVNWVNLDGVTGIEVPNGDVEAFAGAIDKLLTDDNLAKTYSEAAHQRVAELFTVGKMMEEMEKCYKELSNHAE